MPPSLIEVVLPYPTRFVYRIHVSEILRSLGRRDLNEFRLGHVFPPHSLTYWPPIDTVKLTVSSL